MRLGNWSRTSVSQAWCCERGVRPARSTASTRMTAYCPGVMVLFREGCSDLGGPDLTLRLDTRILAISSSDLDSPIPSSALGFSFSPPHFPISNLVRSDSAEADLVLDPLFDLDISETTGTSVIQPSRVAMWVITGLVFRAIYIFSVSWEPARCIGKSGAHRGRSRTSGISQHYVSHQRQHRHWHSLESQRYPFVGVHDGTCFRDS